LCEGLSIPVANHGPLPRRMTLKEKTRRVTLRAGGTA
jgi:hypothetical protein